MKVILKLIIDNLLNSFSTNELGWSARKLTAFIITLLVIIIHIKWIMSCYKNSDFSLLPEVLLIDFSTILALLGLTTWERLKIFKKGDSNDNKINIDINTKDNVDVESDKNK